MDLVGRLTPEVLPGLLGRLGVEEQDWTPTMTMVGEVGGDRDARALVDRMGEELLLPHLGHWRDVWQRPGFAMEELDDPRLAGALPLCALLATAQDVHSFHLGRGIEPAVSWASLADLGQQVTKHRLVHGTTGLTHFNWMRNVWSGDFIRLGRLQFELFSREDSIVLNTHIPGDGSMSPAAVEESLLAAPGFFAEHFADLGGDQVESLFCMSWLLDPVLEELLPGTNIADFASRWHEVGGEVKDRDGYYFVFNIEPAPDWELPCGLDELPQRSSLERALVGLWRGGGHLRQVHGMIAAGTARAR